MAIKDLLIYLDNDDSCDCRIANGINVSRHYGAHITGLYVMPMMQVHAYPYAYLPSSVLKALTRERKNPVNLLRSYLMLKRRLTTFLVR